MRVYPSLKLKFLVVVALLCLAPMTLKADPPNKPSGWVLTLEDNFDQIDKTKWSTVWPQYYGGKINLDGRTRRKAFYPDRNVEVVWDDVIKSNVVRIKTVREDTTVSWENNKVYNFTSGILASDTKFRQKYGYFEIRVKADTSGGSDPAFWLVNAERWPPEIDIFELPGIKGGAEAQYNVHWNDPDGTKRDNWKYTKLPNGNSNSTYYTFALLWEPGLLVWYLDGKEVHRSTAGIPQDALALIISNEIDGGAGDTFYGDPAKGTYPQNMYIDYVKVWKSAVDPTPTPTPTATPTPTPSAQVAPFRIDSASTVDYTDPSGKVWKADTGFLSGGGTVTRPNLQIANTDLDVLYHTERWGMRGYHFKVDNGTYVAKLHFAETFERVDAAGKRVFDVKVEGQTLSNLDVFAEAGGRNIALVKTFRVDVTDGVLNIDFTGKVDSPMINAIEVEREWNYSLQLNLGWNLISIPLELQKDQVEDVLASISGKYLAVYSYDTKKNVYQRYIPGLPNNDLKKLQPGQGYWLFMNAAATLNITGSPASKSIELKKDWNLVGFNSVKAMPIEDALASIAGKYFAVYAFDSATNSYKGYSKAMNLNQLTELTPGKGYWIYATQDAVWTLP